MNQLAMLVATVALAAPAAQAQTLKLPAALDQLGAQASDRTDVSLDGALLQVAGAFLDDKDADEAAAKKLIAKLKGLYVHRFEFEGDGRKYSDKDLDGLRAQLQSPPWSRAVSKHSKHPDESVEVYVKREADKLGGLVVISAEEDALTVVEIDGAIVPEDLLVLGGRFGVPTLDAVRRSAGHKDRDQDRDQDKDDDDDR